MHQPTTTAFIGIIASTLSSNGCPRPLDAPSLLHPFVSRTFIAWDSYRRCHRHHHRRHRSSTTRPRLLHGNDLDADPDDLDDGKDIAFEIEIEIEIEIENDTEIPTRRNHDESSFQSAVRRAARRIDPRKVVLTRLAREEETRRKKREEQRRREEWHRHRETKTASSSSEKRRRGIPLVGPFLHHPPLLLLVGSTITLSSSFLTPLQRLAVRVARHPSHGLECAAPIVAVIDRVTDGAAKDVSGRRYATLASIRCLENGSVQLFGVGRAWLHDYYFADANMNMNMNMNMDVNVNVDVDVNDAGDRDSAHLPVVMAEFDLFLDDSSILPSSSSSSSSSKRASSVHALSELHRAANRVYRIHEERKALVAGLLTGLARLRNVNGRGHGHGHGRRPNRSSEDLRDFDGIGLVAGRRRSNDHHDDECDETTTQDDPPTQIRMQIHPLMDAEHMGLGNFGILSTIPALAEGLMLRLEPYYGPGHREREEYAAEVASFVALRTLEAYASPAEMADALLAPSAAVRFGRVYEIMARHREELHEWTKAMREDLEECGEECGDLW